MASAVAPLRGPPLPVNPAPRGRGRDIVSTILSTYGSDPGIQFTPVEEEDWPSNHVGLQPPSRFDRGALYSPRSGSEFGFGSGDDDAEDAHNPPRQPSPLGFSKEGTTEKWQRRMQEQQKEMDRLREKHEKLAGEGKALPAVPQRIDSKFEKDLPLRPSSPLSAHTHLSSPANSEGPAFNLKRSLSRSSKPASLKLHKSNGSTAASIRSAGSSTPPPRPPPKFQRSAPPTKLSQEEAPPPPKHPSHTRSNSIKSTYSVKRKPVQRSSGDASESLPNPPSPVKSASARDKLLPARPIEVDDVTVADLAVKHPAVIEEQSLQATQSRWKPQLTASQQIDQILDQSSTTSDTQLRNVNRVPRPPLLSSPSPTSPDLTSSAEDADMKKLINKIKAKAGGREDGEVADPAIQPGLGAEQAERSFRVLGPGLLRPNQPGQQGAEASGNASEGAPSSGYIERERARAEEKDRPFFTAKWLEDQANIRAGNPFRADSVFRGDDSVTDYDSFHDERSQRSQQRDRTFSETTITQPAYNQFPPRSIGQNLAPTAGDVSLPALDTSYFGSALNLNEPRVNEPGESVASTVETVIGPSTSAAEPATPTAAFNKFQAAAAALKDHQIKIKEAPNPLPPVYGPVRPPYGPIAHLVANRTANQNQVKPPQLECKHDHKTWFGPSPNNVHKVPCQLCLIAYGTLFQCKHCAMVTCPGCKDKVEEAMKIKNGGKSARN